MEGEYKDMPDPKIPSSNVQSPHASDSYSIVAATPGTAFTRISSDEHSRNNESTVKGGMSPPPFPLAGPATNPVAEDSSDPERNDSLDPFVTFGLSDHARGSTTKLSPTATAFTPSTGLPSALFSAKDVRTPASSLTPGSVTFKSDLLPTCSSLNLQQQRLPEQSGAHPVNSSESSGDQSAMCLDHHTTPGAIGRRIELSLAFDCSLANGMVTRHIKVRNDLPGKIGMIDIGLVLEGVRFLGPHATVSPSVAQEGVYYIGFRDIRNSQRALDHLQTSRPQWETSYATTKTYISGTGLNDSAGDSVLDGQIQVSALYDGPRQSFEAYSIATLLQNLLQTFGELMLSDTPVVKFPALLLRVEYYDSGDAEKAFALAGIKVAGTTFSVASFDPTDDQFKPPMTKALRPTTVRQDTNALESGRVQERSKNKKSPTGHTEQTGSIYMAPPAPQAVTTHSVVTIGAQRVPMSSEAVPDNTSIPTATFWSGTSPGVTGQQCNLPPHLRSHAANIPSQRQRRDIPSYNRTPDSPSGHNNVVDLYRIAKGLDVRTTIMLRNIPNKIDQSMLKGILDETSYGRYDFMYLRIDFANNCNVGYAFINFQDPDSIVPFVEARVGQRWGRFGSEKVAEVSYATIQGKDCLVQKFRNSSVMLEHPSFRPKIFILGDAPHGGMEDEFPGPDNASKMRRSVENAEHVGLFAPKAGQHYRDEQRRRRSQYDRGTPSAEMDDALSNASHGASYSVPALASHGLTDTTAPYHAVSHHASRVD